MIASVFFVGAVLAILTALAAALRRLLRTAAVLLAQGAIFASIGYGLRWNDWVMTAVPAALLVLGFIVAYSHGARPYHATAEPDESEA